MAMRRLFSTPKGLLLIIQVFLVAIASRGEGLSIVAPGLIGAVLSAAAIDGLILWRRRSTWTFPDGAILTGLLVAMLLSPHQPAYVFAAASSLAIVSKYAVRSRWANVFNPAAL